jgi:hypothetical protein
MRPMNILKNGYVRLYSLADSAFSKNKNKWGFLKNILFAGIFLQHN